MVFAMTNISYELFSIIIPVYNRRDELLRCLKSLKTQTYSRFEVIIVDDASTVMLQDIVASMDDSRFKYFRNCKNGGPYNARTVGWINSIGQYIINIDSDWEAFPWMIERAKYYLDAYPVAASVSGMHLRTEDSKMFVRVREGIRLVSPEQAAELPPVPDCVGAIRRLVIQEWLEKSHDYFALEAHSWLTFSLKHSQLYVDEPWTLYHTSAANRVSSTIGGRSAVRVKDCLLFLDDHDQILREVNRRDIDLMLEYITLVFIRNFCWSGARMSLNYLRLRNSDPVRVLSKIIAKAMSKKLVGKLFREKNDDPVWL